MRVVLLHSALGDSRLWRRQVAALEPRFEVVAPDLPGWGAGHLVGVEQGDALNRLLIEFLED